MQSKFIKLVNSSYKGILTEQGPEMAAAPAPAMAAAPTPAPNSIMPPEGAPTPAPEETIEEPETRSSSDAFLIGQVAKALLINLDDDDRYKVVKYLKSLDKDNASEIEENLVNMINGYDYQNLDSDLETNFKIPPKNSRKVIKFLDKIMSDYIDTDR
jgi:hypothetical protein